MSSALHFLSDIQVIGHCGLPGFDTVHLFDEVCTEIGLLISKHNIMPFYSSISTFTEQINTSEFQEVH